MVASGFATFLLSEESGATSGWYVATVPQTGGDDALLGTTCADASECWAVGITLGSNTYTPLIERWDGATWSMDAPLVTPAGQGGGIFDVSCVTGSDCWGVGATVDETSGNGNPSGTLVAHWDGATWTLVPSPTPTGPGVGGAILQSVSCGGPTSCTAVGYTTSAGNGNSSGIELNAVVEQWNGTVWSIVPTPASGQTYDELTGVHCVTAADCWAVGNAGPAQQNSDFLPIFPKAVDDQGLIEHWDGATWSIVPSVAEPDPVGGFLSGITCTRATDCWASGATTDPITGRAAGLLVEHWNGLSWADVSSSVPAPSGSVGAILSKVTCLGTAQCWAVGSSSAVPGNSGNSGNSGGGGGNFVPQAFIENWNGTSWSIEPSPDVTALSYLNGVSCVSGVGCTVAGSSATTIEYNNGSPGLRPLVEHLDFPPASNQRLVLGARDGGVFAYGSATFAGSMGGHHLNAPVVGIASSPDGRGYWLVASDGGVFGFGDAPYLGSMGGRSLDAPVVAMAATGDGQGYWLVASDGGVFAFGDATFAGSMGGRHLNAAVVGVASADRGGYWLVAADGGVFAFGDAAFLGAAGGVQLVAPVTGMAAAPDGRGYWLVAADGGVFTYGTSGYDGSVPAQGVVARAPVVGIARTPTGLGYWLAGSDGALYPYGDAAFLGAPDPHRLAAPLVGVAAS